MANNNKRNQFGFVAEGAPQQPQDDFGFVPEQPTAPPVHPFIHAMAESPLTQAILGAGRAVQEPFYQAGALVSPLVGLPKAQLRAPVGKGAAGLAGELAGGMLPFGAAAKGVEMALAGTRAAPLLASTLGRMAGMAGYGALMTPQHRVLGAAFGAGISPIADVLSGAVKMSAPAIRKLAEKAAPYANTYIKGRLSNVLADIRGTSSKATVPNDLFKAQRRYYTELLTPSKDSEVVGRRPPRDSIIPYENRLYTKTDIDKDKLPGDVRQAMLKAGKSIQHLFSPEKYTQTVTDEMRENSLEGRPFMKRKILGYKTVPAEEFYGAPVSKAEWKELPDKFKGDKPMMVRTPILSELSPKGKEYEARNEVLSDWIERTEMNNFQDVDRVKINLNRDIDALPFGDPLRQSYGLMKKGLRDDLADTFKKHGNPEQSRMWDKQDDLYKKRIVPFMEAFKKKTPFWKRYTSGEGKNAPPISRMINEYIQTGKGKDIHEPIENLMQTLPESKRDLAGYTFLREAENSGGKAKIKDMLDLYGKLGSKQRQLLFPAHHEELTNMLNMRKTFPEAFKEPVVEPRRGLPYEKLAGAAGAGVAGITGHPMLAGASALLPYLRESLAKRIGQSPRALRAFLEAGKILPPEMRRGITPERGIVKRGLRAAKEKGTRPFLASALAQALGDNQ